MDYSDCLHVLADNAQAADNDLVWPAASWGALRDAGVLGWSIAAADGGSGRDLIGLLTGYEQIASACLTTSFILSQRESATRHLHRLPDDARRHELLAALASGAAYATVGLSQLTTSRQHQQPALAARRRGDKYILDGTIPWVTGASQARHIVIGAVTEDNQQIVVLLPSGVPGVHVGPPLDLMALRGSLTAEIRLDNVELDSRQIVAGPAQRVLATGKGGAGGLETSCLALGLASAAIAYVSEEAGKRPDLEGSADSLRRDHVRLRQEMHRLAEEGGTPEITAALRADANSLVLRSTQVALTVSKGAGFLRSHPAQRWARQALFFLVWSCPRPTTEATLAELSNSRMSCDL